MYFHDIDDILKLYRPKLQEQSPLADKKFKLELTQEREESWHTIPEEVQVIVRFIKAPIKDVGLITLYTNSQNPVNPLQLKSNDPLQGRLQEDLRKFSPSYFYSIKEGDWQLICKKEKKKFKPDFQENHPTLK
jgi:hypothetical protein